MPDPGEPHRPEREHFASEADYREALETYIQITYSLELSLSDLREIAKLLEDRRER